MFREFIVKKITPEGTRIKSFHIVRRDGAALESFLPGQFISVRIPTPNMKGVIRNYTLSEQPGLDYFRITVKREQNGIASNFLHDNIRVGDIIEASAPAGAFYLDTSVDTPVVLLSGGVGITPMMSMLEYVVKHQRNRVVYFLHSSENMAVQPMASRLQELATLHKNMMLNIHHTNMTEPEIMGLDYHRAGYITQHHLRDISSLSDASYYLCGPTSFMQDMYDHLIQIGISSAFIHYEFFGNAMLLGKPARSSRLTNTFEVMFKKSGKAANWTGAHQNILELAESMGIPAAYSCKMGTCATCETAIEGGEVEYNPEPLMEAQAGSVFICCSQPSTNIILDL